MTRPARTEKAPRIRTASPIRAASAATRSRTSLVRIRITFGNSRASRSWIRPSCSFGRRAAASRSWGAFSRTPGLDDEEEVDAERPPVDSPEARHLQPERDALDVEVERRAEPGADPLRELLLEAHLGRVRVRPEGSRDDAVVLGESRHVGEPLLARERPALAARVSLRPGGQAAGVLPVDGGEARRDDRDRDDPRRPFGGETRLDAGPLVGLDVEEKRGRGVRRQVGGELPREVALDEGDVEDDERSEAEGQDRADRSRSRSDERREAVPEGEGELLPAHVGHEPEQPARGEGEDEGGDREAGGEEGGDPRQTRLDPGGRSDAGEEERPAEELQRSRGRDRLGVPAQDACRGDPADREEGGDSEEQRNAQPEAEAAQERLGLPRVEPSRREEVGVRSPDAGDEADACHGAEEAPEKAEARRLHRVEKDGLLRGDAEAAEDREGVEAARDPRANRLRDADTADEERREGDEAEEPGRPADRFAQLGLAVQPALHAEAGRPFEACLQRGGRPSRGGDVGPLGEVQEDAAGDPAAEPGEARPREPLPRDEDPRSDPEGTGEAVGLGDDRSGDPEAGAAERDLLADRHAEPAQEVGVGDDRVGGEERAERPVRVEAQLADERVVGLDRLQLDEKAARGEALGHGRRPRLEDDGDEVFRSGSGSGDRLDRARDGRRERLERLDGEVGPEEGARLAPDRLLERARETRDRHDGGDPRPEARGEEESFVRGSRGSPSRAGGRRARPSRRRLVPLDPPVAEVDPAAGEGGDGGVVRDEDEGGAALAPEVDEDVEDRGARRAVEVPRRLVGEEERRARTEGPGQRHALLLAPGELGGVVVARARRGRRPRGAPSRALRRRRGPPARAAAGRSRGPSCSRGAGTTGRRSRPCAGAGAPGRPPTSSGSAPRRGGPRPASAGRGPPSGRGASTCRSRTGRGWRRTRRRRWRGRRRRGSGASGCRKEALS